jgi:hypothetical protein
LDFFSSSFLKERKLLLTYGFQFHNEKNKKKVILSLYRLKNAPRGFNVVTNVNLTVDLELMSVINGLLAKRHSSKSLGLENFSVLDKMEKPLQTTLCKNQLKLLNLFFKLPDMEKTMDLEIPTSLLQDSIVNVSQVFIYGTVMPELK